MSNEPKEIENKRVIIFQASSSLIDVSYIEKRLVPEYFSRLLGHQINNSPVNDIGHTSQPEKSIASEISRTFALREPTEGEIESLEPIDRPIELATIIENLVHMQTGNFSYSFDPDELSEEKSLEYNQIKDSFCTSWFDILNSGDCISDEILSTLSALSEQGYKIKIINDITRAREGCYRKLSDCIPDFDLERDLVSVSIMGLEKHTPSSLFKGEHISDSSTMVFTNNTGLLSRSYEAGCRAAYCTYFTRHKDVMLPLRQPSECFFETHTVSDIKRGVETSFADYHEVVNKLNLPNPKQR